MERQESLIALALRLQSRVSQAHIWTFLQVCEQHWIESWSDLEELEDELLEIGVPGLVVTALFEDSNSSAASKADALRNDELKREPSRSLTQMEDVSAVKEGSLNEPQLEILYSEDNEENGFIAMCARASGRWVNPDLAGLISVNMSSRDISSAEPHVLFDRSSAFVLTEDSASDITFDLKQLRLSVRHVSLFQVREQPLRDWSLSASEGGEEWELLLSSASLVVSASTYEVDADKSTFYRFLRLSQSSRLALVGIELYGIVSVAASISSPHRICTAPSCQYEELQCRFSSDFDENGVIFCIGSRHGREDFSNPDTMRCVSVHSSSLAEGSWPLSEILSRHHMRQVSTCTAATSSTREWIMIDLNQYEVCPTNYTLGHDCDSSFTPMRSWTLEASAFTNDVDEWVELRAHRNELVMARREGFCTWSLPPTSQFFRRFRLVSGTDTLSITCSSFELYGVLRRRRDGVQLPPLRYLLPAPSELAETTLLRKGDGLEGGLIEYLALGGGKDAQASSVWLNPVTSGLATLQSSKLSVHSASLSKLFSRSNRAIITSTTASRLPSITCGFMQHRIHPTEYALQSSPAEEAGFPRSWVLEASVDELSWSELSRHELDESMGCGIGTAFWKLQCPPLFFSHFRLRMTAPNSKGKMCFSLAAFELYGYVQRQTFGDAVASTDVANIPAPVSAEANREKDVFQYSHNMDTNGILYHLGTDFGRSEYSNPALSNRVVVSSSKLVSDSAPSYAIAGRDLVRCVTKQNKSANFVIDLLNVFVQPTHYTLRHYDSWDTECLRNWVFQGSEGSNWVNLMVHTNDTSLSKRGQAHTWMLPHQEKYFNIFRILLTGKNSNRHYYLALSGFEIYGHMSVHDARNMRLPRGARPRSLPSTMLLAREACAGHEESGAGTAAVHDSRLEQPRILQWDNSCRSKHIAIIDKTTALNRGSKDHWQSVRCSTAYDSGRVSVRVRLSKCPPTTNVWKTIVGVVDSHFCLDGKEQWVCSQGSWGYIANGAKCYHSTRTEPYGTAFGAGNIVTVVLDFDASSIEFAVDGISQGVAFSNLRAPAFVCVSMTATGAAVELVDERWEQSSRILWPLDASYQMSEWDTSHKSDVMQIDALRPQIVRCGASNDSWKTCRSRRSVSSGRHFFEFKVLVDAKTRNKWRIMIGVVPSTFEFGRLQWLGSQHSWGYAAYGVKCHIDSRGEKYGEKYGTGDRVGIALDFDAGTISFYKNRRSLGVAFTDLSGVVHAAVSLCGQGSEVLLREVKSSPASIPEHDAEPNISDHEHL